MTNTYIDVFAYKRAVTGLEKDSLIGNAGRLTAAVIAGATSLPVGPNTTVALSMFDQVTIFDGPNSEVAQVNANISTGASSIPLLQPLQFAHAQYTPFCTDGVLGSLADAMVEASNWIENVCQQSLYQQTYTSETLQIPSMRASFDNRGRLVFRPRHFPIVTDSGITIESNTSDSITYDQTQIILDATNQIVTVPWLVPRIVVNTQGSLYSMSNTYDRGANLYLLITYTAGYLPGSMPGDIRDCTVMLTSEILARRRNPSGAVAVSLGDSRVQISGSRDTVGESLLVKMVKRKLQPYSVEAY